MGSPEFALPTLDALVESGRYRPVMVVTQPDRQRGRGRRTSPTPVKARASDLGIPVREMAKPNYAEVTQDITAIRPDAIVVVAFGIIIKRDLLELPTYGCVNVHASLLPKYRGVSPIQAAILAGDRVTGCTTMMMDEGVDTGGLLLQDTTEIRPDDTAGTLSQRLAELGAGLLIRTLDGLRSGSIAPVSQDDSKSSYTNKIKKTDGEIDWSRDAASLERHVRAMTPWPSAYTFRGGNRLIVIDASVVDDGGGRPGTVVSLNPLRVACKSGALEIHLLKPEGKRGMTPDAYLAGYPLKTGEVLG
jgi:methionyl-tRNA formyltransferase